MYRPRRPPGAPCRWRPSGSAASILVNNAGRTLSTPLLDTSVDDWGVILAVNARGDLLHAREAVLAMKARGDRKRRPNRGDRRDKRAGRVRLDQGSIAQITRVIEA